MSIAEKLDMVAQNQQKVFDAGGLAQHPKKTVSGEIISINDVAPVEHTLGVKASSKNILPNTYKSKNAGAIIYTVNEDGTINISNSGGNSLSVFNYVENNLGDLFIDGETYTFALNTEGKYDTISLYIYAKDLIENKEIWLIGAKNLETKYLTINKSKYQYIKIYTQIQANTEAFENVVVKPVIALGKHTTLPHTPYVDISTVNINALGKNLIPFPYATTDGDEINGVKATVKDDGTIIFNGTATGKQASLEIVGDLKLKKGVPYTLSGCSGGGTTNTSVRLFLQNTTYKQSITVGGGINSTIIPEYDDYYLTFLVPLGKTVDNFMIKPMLEVGESATEFELYKEPTSYTPNADGTVEGVKSIYPTTTLVPSEQGVLVECEYSQDAQKSGIALGKQSEYDAFWDKLQNYGKPSAYGNLFSCTAWTDEIYNPKYTIKALSANSMFGGSIITDTKVPIDLTENNGQVFYIFQNAKKLVTINKLILKNNQSLSKYFEYCTALKNLNIEGVISKDVDLQHSTLLTKASIENVVGCLSDTTGAKLILSATAVNNAFETSKDAADGSTSEEWLSLIAPKSNNHSGLWAISLM